MITPVLGIHSLQGSAILAVGRPRITRRIRKLLAEHAYEVETADNFEEARVMLEDWHPDLMLVSLSLGVADAFDFARGIRGNPQWRSIPLIFLGTSDRRVTVNVREALSLGNEYIAAPTVAVELVGRVQSRLEAGPLPDRLPGTDLSTGLLSGQRFDDELERELYRFRRRGSPAALASISFPELASVRENYGESGVEYVMRQAANAIRGRHRLLDLLARTGPEEFAMLLPETTAENGRIPLDRMTAQIAVSGLDSSGGRLRLTPVVGIADFSKGGSAADLWQRARQARHYAESQLDLRAVRWERDIDRWATSPGAPWPSRLLTRAAHGLGRFLLPAEVALTMALGLFLPLLIYLVASEAGVDISRIVYLVVVASLVITGALIWIEGFLAFRTPRAPAEPGEPYPTATAIIAAYLPNEAATLLETLNVFLELDYPADLQVILAYNTPHPLPIEGDLRQLADQHPSLQLLRVANSTSKAQNVNAALREARGRFVGVFDADHHPQKDSFMRAWRWLSNGYAVVQGHCMVRNGNSSTLARLLAIEFEAMYAVSHPGRSRLHGFAVFGGSNGYWKTDVLHKIRMRSSMLTEDIDSSIRLLMSGDRIVCDPRLVSTELAPVKLGQLWNQRMRWAQGWFQVSLNHLWRALFSSRFSVRQKLGICHLLFWREIYPWIALQIIPLIAFWSVKYGGIERLDWMIPIFVLTTLFTLSVGPGQSILAYLLSEPRIKRHAIWFVAYFFFASVFYAEFKNTISRVAQLRQFLGESDWVVTPRAPESVQAESPLGKAA